MSFTDLDLGSEMIIFDSILTPFEASFIFEAPGTGAKISSSLKLKHQKQIQLA